MIGGSHGRKIHYRKPAIDVFFQLIAAQFCGICVIRCEGRIHYWTINVGENVYEGRQL